jgi:ADP-heptose:LPS heptosyltransferase
MARVLERLAPGARVLVVRLRSLGDCVLATPAIHLLKQFRPDLAIGVMVEDRFSGVYEGNPDIAAILPPSKRAAFAFRPALTLNLHGGPTSAVLTAASLARWRAGFAHYKTGWAHNVKIPRAQQILGEERKVHTAEHVASAMFFLGVPRTEIGRARLFVDGGGGAPCVAVHPFASAAAKAWPAERFVAAARAVARGREVAVLAGPGDDVGPFREFTVLAGAPLAEVKRALSRAALFLGNDSGPAHMAAAFGVPVVVLYGASDPVVWAPWRTRSRIIVEPEGLARVSVERVAAAAAELEAEP